MVSVEIKIVTMETDPYARYHGRTIDEPLDSSFWDTQGGAQFTLTGSGFTYTEIVELAEGSHYVIYGNSSISSYPWYAQIFANGALIAEGGAYRDRQLIGDFIVGDALDTLEPDWEHDSFYRGIEILVWMPDGTPFTAYFNDTWYMHDLLSAIQEAIDDFLGPAPPISTPLLIGAGIVVVAVVLGLAMGKKRST